MSSKRVMSNNSKQVPDWAVVGRTVQVEEPTTSRCLGRISCIDSQLGIVFLQRLDDEGTVETTHILNLNTELKARLLPDDGVPVETPNETVGELLSNALRRRKEAVNEAKKAAERIGLRVSAHAQDVFDGISRTYVSLRVGRVRVPSETESCSNTWWFATSRGCV